MLVVFPALKIVLFVFDAIGSFEDVFEVGVEAEFSELLFWFEHGFLNGTNEIKICGLGLNLLIF